MLKKIYKIIHWAFLETAPVGDVAKLNELTLRPLLVLFPTFAISLCIYLLLKYC